MPRSPRLLARLSDDRLIEQARRDNDAAYVAIYDRYASGLLAFCRHMLGSREEAEDALQQTFTSAFSALRSDDRPIVLKPWLYTIARNRCLSMLRARREQPSDEVDAVSTVGLSDQVERRTDLQNLLSDLRTLPERQREALVLSEVGDLSHVDVAEVIGCEPKQVKALVFQARSGLIESRRARDIPCAEIREQLATATGGALRRGPLRRHIQACEGCREFRDEVRKQRAMLAVALPVIPSLGLKETALAAAGVGVGGGGAAGGGGLLAALGAHGATKTAAVVLTAGATVGGLAVTEPELFSGLARGAEGQSASGGGGEDQGGALGSGEDEDSFDWDSARDEAQRTSSREQVVAGIPERQAPEPEKAGPPAGANASGPGGGFGAGQPYGQTKPKNGRGSNKGGSERGRERGRGRGRGDERSGGRPNGKPKSSRRDRPGRSRGGPLDEHPTVDKDPDVDPPIDEEPKPDRPDGREPLPE